MFRLAGTVLVHLHERKKCAWSIPESERKCQDYMDERECVVVDVLNVLLCAYLYRRHQQ